MVILYKLIFDWLRTFCNLWHLVFQGNSQQPNDRDATLRLHSQLSSLFSLLSSACVVHSYYRPRLGKLVVKLFWQYCPGLEKNFFAIAHDLDFFSKKISPLWLWTWIYFFFSIAEGLDFFSKENSSLCLRTWKIFLFKFSLPWLRT